MKYKILHLRHNYPLHSIPLQISLSKSDVKFRSNQSTFVYAVYTQHYKMWPGNVIIQGVLLIQFCGFNTFHISSISQWQSIIPRLLCYDIKLDITTQKTLLESVIRLRFVGTKIHYHICDQPSGNLWYAKDPLLCMGFCGKLTLSPYLHNFSVSTGHQVNFAIIPATNFGINVTFVKFNLPTSEGICSSQVLTLTVRNKDEVHCGHKLPWFRVSENDVNISYLAHTSAGRYIKHDYNRSLGFHIKYSIINRQSAFGTHEKWIHFLTAMMPNTIQNDFQFYYLPTVIHLELKAKVEALKMLNHTSYELNPLAGIRYDNRHIFLSSFVIMSHYTQIIEMGMCLRRCYIYICAAANSQS